VLDMIGVTAWNRDSIRKCLLLENETINMRDIDMLFGISFWWGNAEVAL
jgi:hypothetical protein